MDANDRLLVHKVAYEGDSEAFATLVSRYADMVYSTCARVLRDDAYAADVTQQTFFCLFKSAATVTGSLGSWLHQVATRRAIDLVRQNVARREREEVYAREKQATSDSSWQELEPRVDEAIAQLPEELREVLVQHFLERKSLTQIAANKGVSQPTISRRVAEALNLVREKLRLEGLFTNVAPLQAVLLHSARTAPESLMWNLGKMAVAKTGVKVKVGLSMSAKAGKAGFAVAASVMVVATYLATRSKGPEDISSAPLPQIQQVMATRATRAPVQVAKPAAPAQAPGATPVAPAIARSEATIVIPQPKPAPKPILITNYPPWMRRPSQTVAQAPAPPAINRVPTNGLAASGAFGGGVYAAGRNPQNIRDYRQLQALQEQYNYLSAAHQQALRRAAGPTAAQIEDILSLDPDPERIKTRPIQLPSTSDLLRLERNFLLGPSEQGSDSPNTAVQSDMEKKLSRRPR